MKAVKETTHTPATMQVSHPDAGTLLVHLAGDWCLQQTLPSAAELQPHLDADPSVQRLAFDTQDLTSLDSGLVTFLRQVGELCLQRQTALDQAGLPDGVCKLLALAAAVPERVGARRDAGRDSMLTRIGKAAIATVDAAENTFAFIGEACLAFLKLPSGRARFRRADLMLVLQECSAEALPIVSLISFLVGSILAFIGAVQLQQFGAAFAAQLGSMQVNQEIDALTTMGFAPMEFLVLPRMLALMLLVPLLTVYADLMGILGGAVIGVSPLDVSLRVYFNQLQEALTLTYNAQGLIKSAVYGAIVALSGCLRGMQCGRSAAAVGQAATSAVVTGIVGIIAASATLTVIYLQVW